MDNSVQVEAPLAKVLIVDDNVTNVQLLMAILKKEPYELSVAYDGYEALKLVESYVPDVILLDVMMPGIDGYEVATRIRQNVDNDNVAIIFITALNSTADIVKGFNVGGNDYVTKPVIAAEIVARVRHHISIVNSRKKILEQTEELQRNIDWRDRLYSVVAHDLRDPIGTIKMLFTMMLDKSVNAGSNQIMMEYLEMANSSIEEVFALLDNLLKWTKSQIGNLVVASKKFSIEDIVDGNIVLFEPTCRQKNISINFNQSPDKKMVYADYDMAHTIMRNLINNAIKFSSNNASIDVTVEYDEDFAYISVRDYGVGVKDEHKEKILDSQISHTSLGTKDEKGSGVGLVLCKYFVEKNGGTITFESVYGEGAKFTFTLPLAE